MLDKYEKNALVITGIVIMLFIFSLLYAMVKERIQVTACLPYNKTYTEPKVTQVDKHTYQVFAVARMWNFEPAQIYIPIGSEVDFYLTSKDVVHGFDISDKNVNLMAVFGGISKTTVRFDKPGVYKITCHEYCGAGHENMQAEVIVNYPGHH
ncbi:MAG TPA: hypothetical protein VJ647_01800 [Chitinophagaceae bacterium]|nr:hypothetical protein [Chitinophagaceae bacterium]